MTRRKFKCLPLLLCIATLSYAQGLPPAPSSPSTAQRLVKTIGVAYAFGKKGDLSYNAAASAGSAELRRKGLAIKEFEPSSLDDYTTGLDFLAAQGRDVIFCVGYLYNEPAKQVAAKHPRTLFVVLDGSVSSEPNLTSVKFNAAQGAFLAGAVAGRITKTGVVAFVGGANIPIINEFYAGYSAGAAFAQPTVTVLKAYIGPDAKSFSDPVKGRDIALSLISRGADVVFHAAGQSGNGVFKAAQARHIWAIGVDVDQAYLARGTVLTSMRKDFGAAMAFELSLIEGGAHLAGKINVVGIPEGAVSLSPIDPSTRLSVGNIIDQAHHEALRRFQ